MCGRPARFAHPAAVDGDLDAVYCGSVACGVEFLRRQDAHDSAGDS